MLYRMIRAIACLGVTAAVVCALPAPGPARAADEIRTINWNEYMSSAAMAGAIAAAISRVDDCSKKPLLFQEIDRDKNNRSLVFTCNGTEDEEASSILQIQQLGDFWMPVSFDLAG